jgi:hypothetical protein
MEPTVSDTPPQLSPEQLDALHALLGGYRVSQAMYVAVTLGIPDLLASGPRDGDDLARSTGANAGALSRVLRLLAGVGLFEEVAPRRFALTALGAGLRADAVGTMRPTVLMQVDSAKWESWGHLLYAVRTGEIAFNHLHGKGYFDYLAERPDEMAIFQQAMTANTARSGEDIVHGYDFGGIRRLVDVGGGQGLLLATILKAHPEMLGVLYDRADVVAGASAVLEAAGVAERCEIVAGDFFASVPEGDACILRQIIHDWGDADAARILGSCRRALGPSGKVLVLERAIASDPRRALPVLQLDLHMLVMHGGLQRTDEEYAALFASAGFRLSRVVPLGDAAQFSVFEGVPA